MATTHGTMEEKLRVLGAKVDVLIDELEEHAPSTWKPRIDELQVQAALGGMEARDKVAPVVAGVQRSVVKIQKMVDDLTLDYDGELEKTIGESLRSLRAEIATAEELM